MASTSQAIPGTAHAHGPINANLHNPQKYSAMPAPTSQDTVKISEANKVANALKARKRTKTGCLTCRKRRIKCGEERPTCKNCTKSKRDCEGYIPRVVFKEPAGASGITMQGPYYPQHGYAGADAASFFSDTSGVSLDGASYPAIAPRPSTSGAAYGPMTASGGIWVQGPSYTGPVQAHMNQPFSNIPAASISSYATPHPIHAFVMPNGMTNPIGYGATNNIPNLHPQIGRTTNSSNDIPVQTTTTTWPYSPVSAISQTAQPSPALTQTNFSLADATSVQASHYQQHSWQNFPHHLESGFQRSSGALGENRYLQPILDATQDSSNEQTQAHGMPTQVISIEPEPEDDWFDVDSEDEFSGAKPDISRCDLGMMIARNANDNNGNLRSMTNFLNDSNVLLAYNPSYAASPLRDAQTARIFCHFITATGPTLHVCERHPSNPAVIFSGRPVPKSQQALWSYTLPMLALHHQALLHAMLAIASLHIAKLQQTSPTPSLRHYHYALRRVAKALGNQRKRREPATLAATLLLGFYEVTTAEHNKWNSHLSGARELVMGIPYAKLSRRVEAFRRQKAEEEESRRARGMEPNGFDQASRRFNEVTTLNDRRLDHDLLSTLMGWDTRHDVIGEVFEDNAPLTEPEHTPSQKDVDEYEIQLDLFWWYAKQDMYQSIISGNRLLLSYERWAQCPPRAPTGRLDAVYGTMDHLYLLMARLADFSGKDLPRKKRAHLESQKTAKATRPSPPSPTHTSPNHPPPMYGMMPDPGPVRLPRGFDQAAYDSICTAPAPSDSKPLETAFAEAQKEWNAIADAFDRFHASLGPTYEPLSPEHMTPLSTPFGPAIYYRSYSIACVLCLYFCGRIILTRVQPSMPPAAMAAAGVAAPRTATYANNVGRICAGIQPVSNTAPLNPHHGAALMDVCMGLFHAGVQFRDPAQRGWTITKLRDVARLTGWQTSALIASGCERAWMHFAGLGKGPPYERTMNSTAKDDRIAGRSRDPRMMAERPRDNNDRRFVGVNAGTRVYWAMGILSVEEDMKELGLGDEVG